MFEGIVRKLWERWKWVVWWNKLIVIREKVVIGNSCIILGKWIEVEIWIWLIIVLSLGNVGNFWERNIRKVCFYCWIEIFEVVGWEFV